MPISEEIKAERQQARERAILNTLTHPKSAVEIADDLKVSYYTIQPIVRRMAQEGTLKVSPFKQGSAVKYERVTESAMPMLRHYESKRWATLTEILEVGIAQEGLSNSARAAQALPQIVFNYIALARRVEVGLSKQADVDALRNQVAAIYKTAEVAASFYKQLIDNEQLWGIDHLRRISKAPDFPDDEQLSRYAEKFGS